MAWHGTVPAPSTWLRVTDAAPGKSGFGPRASTCSAKQLFISIPSGKGSFAPGGIAPIPV